VVGFNIVTIILVAFEFFDGEGFGKGPSFREGGHDHLGVEVFICYNFSY
jgi:hypothetical protein